MRGDLYRRRADIIGFVNGIPLVFMECKNVHKDLQRRLRARTWPTTRTPSRISSTTTPLSCLGNGVDAKMGSISSRFEHFHEWKRLAEEEPGAVDMETLLKGVCEQTQLHGHVENFIVFDDPAASR